MADLKSVVENFFDRMRGKTPVSQSEPTETAAPAVPSEKAPSAKGATATSAKGATATIDKKPEGASQTEAPPAATGTSGRTGS